MATLWEEMAVVNLVSFYKKVVDRATSGAIVGAVTLLMSADGTVEFRSDGVLDDEVLMEQLRYVADARSNQQ